MYQAWLSNCVKEGDIITWLVVSLKLKLNTLQKKKNYENWINFFLIKSGSYN